MPNADALRALDHLKSGDLLPGEGMEAAHQICQQREGEALFDLIHALVHRIEGDDGNAAYWYRRAGQSRHDGAVEEEWAAIRSVAES